MDNKGVHYELKNISGWHVDYKHKRYTDSNSTNSNYECNLFKPVGSHFYKHPRFFEVKYYKWFVNVYCGRWYIRSPRRGVGGEFMWPSNSESDLGSKIKLCSSTVTVASSVPQVTQFPELSSSWWPSFSALMYTCLSLKKQKSTKVHQSSGSRSVQH